MPASTLTHALGFGMSIGTGMSIGDSEPAPILKAKKKKTEGDGHQDANPEHTRIGMSMGRGIGGR